MVNWSRYLESLCNAYAQWWQVYTITDVVGRKQEQLECSPFLFDFGLMVQTVDFSLTTMTWLCPGSGDGFIMVAAENRLTLVGG